MALDNPDNGTENDDDLDDKLRAEAERMTASQANRPAQTDDEPEPQEESDEPAPTPEVKPAEPARYKVKVRGEEIDVPLDELLNGYSRQEDYSRDKNALKDERQRVLAEGRSQYEQLNNRLIEEIRQYMPKRPEMAMLDPNSDKYNPDQYHLQNAHYTQASEHLAFREGEKRRLDGERQAEAQRQRGELLQTVESEIRSKFIPEWKDDEAYHQGVQILLSHYARGPMAFSQQEIADYTTNPKLVALAHKAMLYDKMSDKKAIVEHKVKDAPPVTKPGAAKVQDTESDEVRRLKAQVKKNPRDDRAVAALFAAQDKQRARANPR